MTGRRVVRDMAGTLLDSAATVAAVHADSVGALTRTGPTRRAAVRAGAGVPSRPGGGATTGQRRPA